jgi:putative membrane protein
MKSLSYLALGIASAFLLTLTGMAFAGVQPQEAEFLKTAAQTDLAEIKMGQLAQQQGKHKDVQQFGKTLVTDHQKALTSTRALAKTLGVMLPDQPTADQQQKYSELATMRNGKFDTTFVSMMIMGHQKAISEFKAQAPNGTNMQVKQLAQSELPVLQKHLRLAQEAQGKIGTAEKLSKNLPQSRQNR